MIVHIQRYSLSQDVLVEHDSGPWVRYDDMICIIQRLSRSDHGDDDRYFDPSQINPGGIERA